MTDTSVHDAAYPDDHEDQCATPFCCGFHAWSGKDGDHSDTCKRGGPRFDAEKKPANDLDKLTLPIAERTGGKLLGEMTADELMAAFSAGPIQFRDGEVVT